MGENDFPAQSYLKRSYTAVDGLWFMMVEKEFGFEKALEIDCDVWEVMPKIQARFLRDILGLPDGLEGLYEGFSKKLQLDDCEFQSTRTENEIVFTLTKCPWHEMMIGSGREHLSPRIGKTICATEFSGWAREFGDTIAIETDRRLCTGDTMCRICFSTAVNM